MSDKQGALDLAVVGNFKTEKKKNDPKRQNAYVTINGYDTGEVKSALQKSIRRGMEAEALYWASELLASGEEYTFWRRIAAITAEDIGLADPDMPGRIAALNDLARLNKEWNIPFMAVMLLCRSKKNREADDAAWYYEVRRKEGWKIPVPPEAIDGHTRRGKGRLYGFANEQGISYEKAWGIEFYYDAALLLNYVEIEDPVSGVGDPWRRVLMEWYGLRYQTYELDECPEIRLLTGAVRNRSRSVVESRVPANLVWRHIEGHLYEIKSFTGEDWYRVDVDREECTCPAFVNSAEGSPCKHIVGLKRELMRKK